MRSGSEARGRGGDEGVPKTRNKPGSNLCDGKTLNFKKTQVRETRVNFITTKSQEILDEVSLTKVDLSDLENS